MNVAWNWIGVGVSIIGGLVLSPYLIHKLGAEGYGVWALCFSLVESYWFLDLGFRSATVKFVAHYWAREEYDKVSEVVNTGITYAGATAALMFLVVSFGARYVDRFFQISPTYRHSFFVLVMLVSFTWCINVVFSLYGACLEALQRFDLYNRIVIITTTLRVPGTLLLLYLGYGLIPIGILVVCSQLLSYALHFYYFRQIFPGYRLSYRGGKLSMFKQMGRYGMHNFLGNLSIQWLNQGPPMLIGHYHPAAFAGYFQMPVRLLQYSGEAIGRIGSITNANAAELTAKGETGALAKLAVYSNRYCVAMFMPLAILLFSHGTAFFELWIPKAAAFCAPLLPILLSAYLIAIVGQYSSSMLLMGLARYQWYSRGLLVEAIFSLVALILVVPKYGIIGAAWVSAGAMIVNRGLFLPWLVSRVMKFGYGWFMQSIYLRPLLAGLPVYAIAMLLRGSILPGKTWFQFLTVGAVIGVLYYAMAFLFCLQNDHKILLRSWVTRKVFA
jgi:O-antigen/teichoic acid export membrane protein